MPKEKVARDYAAAKAAHAKVVIRLREAKAAIVAAMIERRDRGDSNKDIAAAFGLTAQFVNQSLVRSAEYQNILDTKRKERQAVEKERHAAWVEQTRTLIQKADAGANVDDLSVEFGMTAQTVRGTIERCRWVFEERDFPMLAEECLR